MTIVCLWLQLLSAKTIHGSYNGLMLRIIVVLNISRKNFDISFSTLNALQVSNVPSPQHFQNVPQADVRTMLRIPV